MTLLSRFGVEGLWKAKKTTILYALLVMAGAIVDYLRDNGSPTGKLIAAVLGAPLALYRGQVQPPDAPTVPPAAIALLVGASLLFAAPARADEVAPRLSHRSGKLSLALSGPDLTVHPMVGVAPLFGWNFNGGQAVVNPSLVSAVEFDFRGIGGPTFGGSFSVGQTGIPNIVAALGLSFHPPDLATATNGVITNVVVQYQRSLVGDPGVSQIVAGPALTF